MVIIHGKRMFYLQLLPKIMVTFIKKLLRDEKCWRKNHLPAKEKFPNWAQSQLQEFHSQLQNSNPAPEFQSSSRNSIPCSRNFILSSKNSNPAPGIPFPAPGIPTLSTAQQVRAFAGVASCLEKWELSLKRNKIQVLAPVDKKFPG